MRRVILCVALFRIMLKNRVRKSAARRNRVPAKPNRFCGMEERQPIKAKPYFYKNTASQKACRDVVEMGGIEPPSEEASPQGATSVVCD